MSVTTEKTADAGTLRARTRLALAFYDEARAALDADPKRFYGGRDPAGALPPENFWPIVRRDINGCMLASACGVAEDARSGLMDLISASIALAESAHRAALDSGVEAPDPHDGNRSAIAKQIGAYSEVRGGTTDLHAIGISLSALAEEIEASRGEVDGVLTALSVAPFGCILAATFGLAEIPGAGADPGPKAPGPDIPEAVTMVRPDSGKALAFYRECRAACDALPQVADGDIEPEGGGSIRQAMEAIEAMLAAESAGDRAGVRAALVGLVAGMLQTLDHADRFAGKTAWSARIGTDLEGESSILGNRMKLPRIVEPGRTSATLMTTVAITDKLVREKDPIRLLKTFQATPALLCLTAAANDVV